MSTPPTDRPDDDPTLVRPALAPEPASADHTAAAPAQPASPAPRPRRRRLAVGLGVLGGVAAVLVVLYVLAYWVTGNRLPHDAVVSGVAVGGLDPTEAKEALVAELGPRTRTPIPVTVGARTASVDPVAAGLSVDYVASVRAAGGGRDADPRQILRVLTGGTRTEAVVAVEQDRLSRAVERLATRVGTAPVDAGLRYRDGAYQVTRARDGVRLQQQPAETALVRAFPSGGAAVELPVERAEPSVTTAEAEEGRRREAQPAISGPVRVDAGSAGSFRVTPAMIAQALRFTPRDGELTRRLDPEDLRRAADDAVAEVEVSRPRDATVRLVDGRPRVVPAVDGTSVSAKALADAVEPVLDARGGKRVATLALDGRRAAFSTRDAERLGIKEVTGEFTTYFPYAAYRNVNIGRAAQLINGTVLRPGQTFSLNRVVGERTRANGFTEGFVISGGKFQRELGGGVSQSATTTYNAMFFAGLQDVEHQPHTLYIDRYPPGREATVAWPDLDLKFKDDTRYGVLVQASTVPATPSRRGSITVRMWSTKTWDAVTSTTPQKSDFTSGRDIVDTSASCEPQAPAQGFDVSYARLFQRDGQVVRRQSFSWRYAPTDRITCG